MQLLLDIYQKVFLFAILGVAELSSPLKQSAKNGLKESPLTHVSAVLGSKALLPCDVTPPDPGDRPILVLFYKGLIGTPVYSLDARDGPLGFGTQWVDSNIFESRVNYDLNSKVQGLVLKPVKEEDHSLYRCRVDFHSSPTRNSRIKLDVIIPPTKLTITNGAGVKIGNVVGSYNVGATLTLSCRVEGGRPRPQVSWWWRNSLIDESAEVRRGDLTVNTVTIRNLQRKDIGSDLACVAYNTNTTEPLKEAVTIDMILPPSEVEITGNEAPIEAGGTLTLVCKATGSKPPAEITWWKDGVHVANVLSQVNKAKNTTRSSLRLHLLKEDDQSQIVCRAKNPFLTSAVVEATRKISVLYAPKLKLIPGPNINMKDIEEGDDVYIECRIKANPRTSYVEWFHQNKKLHHNISEGIIQSNQSLVLQNVRKSMSGNYVCSASNKQGSGTSNQLFISVKYLPECQRGQQLVYGAEKNEEINASCGVQSNPPPSSYQWAFNSSSEIVPLADIKGENGNRISYTPETDLNFGSLLCWAVNDVGKQKYPCVFHVIHSVIPEPVSNCTVVNLTSVSASISCVAGWDGGLEQTFKLRVSQWPKNSSVSTRLGQVRDSPRVLAKTSITPKPQFLVTGLRPGSEYKVSISAINKKGQSQERHVMFKTPGVITESKGVPETEALTMNFSSVMAVLSGISIIFLLVCVGIVGIMWTKRSSHRRHPVKISFTKEMDDVSVHYMECEQPKSSLTDSDHKTPDIIPIKNKNGSDTMISPTNISLGSKSSEVPTENENSVASPDVGRGCSNDYYEPSEILHVEKRKEYADSAHNSDAECYELLTPQSSFNSDDLHKSKIVTDSGELSPLPSSFSYNFQPLQSPLEHFATAKRSSSRKSNYLGRPSSSAIDYTLVNTKNIITPVQKLETLPRRKHEVRSRLKDWDTEADSPSRSGQMVRQSSLTTSNFDDSSQFDRESAV
ncbi:UNVERIFIED_CONTAM: hypothetical protein RMT77_012491 [Armadillidium vulgare]